MWDNLARSIVEYSTLDLMWDHDLVHPSRGRIEVAQASIDRWAALLADKRPSLGFAAHLANWELAALAMSVHGRQAAIPMRTPKIRALADEFDPDTHEKRMHPDSKRSGRHLPDQSRASARP
jgi:KDO2-lipid IV(A) lauroyltransferase